MLTGHFTRPDVPDVWSTLAGANVRYWSHWPRLVWSNPLLVAGFLAGGWALWCWFRTAAYVVLAVGLVGAILAAAHPDVNAGDRVYALLWLPVVLGLPVAVWRAASMHPVVGVVRVVRVSRPVPARR
ncbi:hypothetical protein [Labedaea rhizosphaerae]|uniref:Uncharacterized protein n=1 Tax=Labedaea rhizosphaerae TaxID=598644 RepID=A0A4V3CYP3_LABRH|nr:hypothetical protein [Labedaea rhizosphaerae]TDP94958.1 hypothetical protein EV186_105190 [Labedaea rhizosphaerae]